MVTLLKVFFIFVLIVITSQFSTSDNHFCIKNDSNKDTLQGCDILATILTEKEKDIFHRTMCKDQVQNIKGDYSYFRLQEGKQVERPSFKRICQDQYTPLLTWITLETVESFLMKELNKSEIHFFLGKATNKNRSTTELCFFSQASLFSNDVSCKLLDFEDDVFGSDSDINVLVEISPISYEIRNITFKPWTRVTHSYKTLLGKSVLKNPYNEKKMVYGNIDCGYIEKIKINTSNIVNDSYESEQVPISFKHDDYDFLLVNGTETIEVREKSLFGRILEAQSATEVDLIGQWSEHAHEFDSDLFANFGYGMRQYQKSLQHTIISFFKISSIEAVYENVESIVVSKKNNEFASAKLTQEGIGASISTVTSVKPLETKWWKHPYPEFFPFFFIGCLLVALALLIPVGKMILILKREGKF